MSKMKQPALVKALAKVAGPENVLAAPRDLITYSYDATGKRSLPDAVVLASNTAEVAAVMKLAHREQVPVVARGAGTNLSGGTVPSQGGIVLELSRLNRILNINTAQQRAVVEPGVVNLDLQNALRPLGFMYAPDPASQKTSTLGGNLGEDAGGPHCLRYGVTHNHVLGLELVTADGQVVEVGAPTDDSYGYDFPGLITGSEGTLGIATKLVLRIMHLPECFQTMLAIFETLEDAFQCASDVIAAGIAPGALELLDAPVIQAVEDTVHAGYPLDAEAVLLIELDALQDVVARQTEQITRICHRNNTREVRLARSAAERDVIWSGRRGAFGAVARVRPAYACHDATVPRNKLVPMLHEVAKIAEKYKLLIGHVAHAGDGNFHPLIMFDNRDPGESQRVEKAGKEILAAGVALGGTITGEHGIGLEKQDSLPLMFNHTELALLRQIKTVFDRAGILNPGKIIPSEKTAAAQAHDDRAISALPEKNKSLHDRLATTLGRDNVTAEPQEMAAYQIDDRLPALVVFPSGIDDICRVVRTANRDETPVIPWGNGSKQALGLPLTRSGIILALKRMNRLIELDTDNLTVEVEAGINHAELQEKLAEHGLYFPLEPEDMASATIGGSLASNSSGPGRLAHGTARDLVLGVTVIIPQGEVIHAGIKTMKNVAGYDLRKLFLGSRGTLGVISKAILKLSHLPEDHSTLLLRFSSIGDALRVTSEISNSVLQPESMEIINARAARQVAAEASFNLQREELLLLIRVAGSREEVKRHTTDIRTLAKANNARISNVVSSNEEEKAWASQRQIQRYSAPAMVRGKAAVPLDRTGDMFQEVAKAAARHNLQVAITARAGNGILYPRLFTEDPVASSNNKVLSAITDIAQSAEHLGGFFLVESGPAQLRQACDPVSQRSDYELMQRLKQSFDPKNIFNPGRIARAL